MDEMMLQFVNTLAAACGAAAPNMRHYREDRFHSINESILIQLNHQIYFQSIHTTIRSQNP